VVEAVETSGALASALAAMGSQDEVGPQAILLEHLSHLGKP
jgi:hypothetical protein